MKTTASLYSKLHFPVIGFVFAVASGSQCNSAQWVRNTGLDINNISITSEQSGWGVYTDWYQRAAGNVAIAFGSQGVTNDVDGGAEASVETHSDGPYGGGDTGIATLSAHAGGTWDWTGAPGTSPSVTIHLAGTLSGSISFGISQNFGGDAICIGAATAYSVGNLGCSPPTNSAAGYLEEYSSGWDAPTLLSTNATLSSVSTNYIQVTQGGITHIGTDASADYTITINSSYTTTAGAGSVTMSAYVDCYTDASFYGYFSGLGRAWGGASANASCIGQVKAWF